MYIPKPYFIIKIILQNINYLIFSNFNKAGD